MGLLKKLKKGVKKIAKVALKTAPLWSSFVPGGSIVTKLVGATRGMRQPSGAAAFDPFQQQALSVRPSAVNVFQRRFGASPARNPKFARQLAGMRARGGRFQLRRRARMV